MSSRTSTAKTELFEKVETKAPKSPKLFIGSSNSSSTTSSSLAFCSKAASLISLWIEDSSALA
jgi:hypothetical protein